MTIRLVLADITTLEVDAIVNAANSELVPGGGVDGAIHRVAGVGLFSELKARHSVLPPGEAIITDGYRLPAKHVIHTVAPMWIEGLDNQVEILSDCYRNALRVAKEHDLKSIAFPSLGTGAFGIPKEIAMPTALNAISLELQNSHSDIEVTICCYTQEDLEWYESVANELGALKEDGGLVEVSQLLPKCPICFHPLKRIIYGMPSRETLEDQDNIYIGGCIIMGDDPDLGCKNCDWRGFIGDIDLIEGEWVALVVDLARKRFVAGALYDAGQPRSALMLTPGIPEFQRGFTNEWFEEHIANCQEPSFWLGNRGELMQGSFQEILMRYPRVTEEVMEFAGFRLLDAMPSFSIDLT
jgi:O-acetyl-ADP-ribose deacetylase (regulator of RNase III)